MHILIIMFHDVSYEIAIIQADANASASGKSQRQAVAEAGQGWGLFDVHVDVFVSMCLPSNSHWNRENNTMMDQQT